MSIALGQHLHQFPAQFEDKLMALRLRSATVLDLDAGYYIGRLDRPDMLWTVRLYHPDMMARQPEEVAGAVIVEAQKWQAQLGNRVTYQYCNELELGIEHGNNPGSQAYWESDDGFRARRDWHLRVVRSLKQRAPWVRVGGPASSPGHQDVDGRQEIRLLAEAGYFDYVDVFLGHFYAEGIDRGGFDAPDKEWYADRVLKARALLDECGYAHLPIIVGECNRKQIDQGDVAGELDRYLARIDGAVERLDWFIWSSPDPGFGDFQWWRAPDPVNNFNRLADKYAGAAPAPQPEPTPEPPPVPPQPTSPAIAVIEARYGISHTDSPTVVLAELTVRGDPPNIRAEGPADMVVFVETRDGQHRAEGMGAAELSFGQPAIYYPTQGQTGFYVAKVGGAEVRGLGWPFGVPGDSGAHTNVVARFARRPTEPTPEPEPPAPEPPATDAGWFGAFADYYTGHPAIGPATGPIAYVPNSYQAAIQESATTLLVWNGAAVFAIAKPGATAPDQVLNMGPDAMPQRSTAMENYGLGPEFNEGFWRRPEEEVVNDLVKGGMPKDHAIVAVRAVQNAAGDQSDAQANREGGMKVTRVQAPGAGGPNDASPDSLDAARAQNADDYK